MFKVGTEAVQTEKDVQIDLSFFPRRLGVQPILVKGKKFGTIHYNGHTCTIVLNTEARIEIIGICNEQNIEVQSVARVKWSIPIPLEKAQSVSLQADVLEVAAKMHVSQTCMLSAVTQIQIGARIGCQGTLTCKAPVIFQDHNMIARDVHVHADYMLIAETARCHAIRVLNLKVQKLKMYGSFRCRQFDLSPVHVDAPNARPAKYHIHGPIEASDSFEIVDAHAIKLKHDLTLPKQFILHAGELKIQEGRFLFAMDGATENVDRLINVCALTSGAQSKIQLAHTYLDVAQHSSLGSARLVGDLVMHHSVFTAKKWQSYGAVTLNHAQVQITESTKWESSILISNQSVVETGDLITSPQHVLTRCDHSQLKVKHQLDMLSGNFMFSNHADLQVEGSVNLCGNSRLCTEQSQVAVANLDSEEGAEISFVETDVCVANHLHSKGKYLAKASGDKKMKQKLAVRSAHFSGVTNISAVTFSAAQFLILAHIALHDTELCAHYVRFLSDVIITASVMQIQRCHADDSAVISISKSVMNVTEDMVMDGSVAAVGSQFNGNSFSSLAKKLTLHHCTVNGTTITNHVGSEMDVVGSQLHSSRARYFGKQDLRNSNQRNTSLQGQHIDFARTSSTTAAGVEMTGTASVKLEGALNVTQSKIHAPSIGVRGHVSSQKTEYKGNQLAIAQSASFACDTVEISCDTVKSSGQMRLETSQVTAPQLFEVDGALSSGATRFQLGDFQITAHGDAAIYRQPLASRDKPEVSAVAPVQATDKQKRTPEVKATRLTSYGKLVTDCHFSFDEDVTLGYGSTTQFDQAEVRTRGDIVFDCHATVSGKGVQMYGRDMINYSNQIHFREGASFEGRHFYNTIGAQFDAGKSLTILVDGWVLNMMARLKADQMNITGAFNVNLFGDMVARNSLAVNTLVHLNCGLMRSWRTSINSLISLNYGLVAPLVMPEAGSFFTWSNFFQAARLCGVQYFPLYSAYINLAMAALPWVRDPRGQYKMLKKGLSIAEDGFHLRNLWSGITTVNSIVVPALRSIHAALPGQSTSGTQSETMSTHGDIASSVALDLLLPSYTEYSAFSAQQGILTAGNVGRTTQAAVDAGFNAAYSYTLNGESLCDSGVTAAVRDTIRVVHYEGAGGEHYARDYALTAETAHLMQGAIESSQAKIHIRDAVVGAGYDLTLGGGSVDSEHLTMQTGSEWVIQGGLQVNVAQLDMAQQAVLQVSGDSTVLRTNATQVNGLLNVTQQAEHIGAAGGSTVVGASGSYVLSDQALSNQGRFTVDGQFVAADAAIVAQVLQYTQEAQVQVKDAYQVATEEASIACQMQVRGDHNVLEAPQVDWHETASLMGSGALQQICARGKLAATMTNERFSLQHDDIHSVKDLLQGTGEYAGVRPARLDVAVDQTVHFQDAVHRAHGGFSLQAQAVTSDHNVSAQGAVFFTSTVGDIQLHSVDHAENIVLDSARDITLGDGTFAAKQNVVVVAARNVTADHSQLSGAVVVARAESGTANLTAAKIKAENYCEIYGKEKVNLSPEIKAQTDKTQHDVVHATAIHGGDGAGYDGVGCNIMSDGDITGVALTIDSVGRNQIYSAHGNVKITPHTYTTEYDTKEKKYCGLKRKKHHHADGHVVDSSIVSRNGGNVIVANEGRVDLTSVQLLSRTGNDVHGTTGVNLLETIAVHSETTKKCIAGVQYDKTTEYDEEAFVTVVANVDPGQTHITSGEGKIFSRGTKIYAPGTTVINGAKGVDMQQSVCSSAYASKGFQVRTTALGFGQAEEKPALSDPFIDSAMRLSQSHSATEYVFNGLDTAQECAHGFNQLTQGNFLQAVVERSGADNYLNPELASVTVGYTRQEAHSETLVTSEIQTDHLLVGSHQSIELHGNIYAREDAVLIAPEVRLVADTVHSGTRTFHCEVSAHLASTNAANFSAAADYSASSSVAHVAQKFDVGGNLHIEADRFLLDGAQVDVGSISGHVNEMEMIARVNEYDERSFACSVSDSGTGAAHAGSAHQEELVAASLHNRSQFDERFQVGSLHMQSATVSADHEGELFAQSITTEDRCLSNSKKSVGIQSSSSLFHPVAKGDTQPIAVDVVKDKSRVCVHSGLFNTRTQAKTAGQLAVCADDQRETVFERSSAFRISAPTTNHLFGAHAEGVQTQILAAVKDNMGFADDHDASVFVQAMGALSDAAYQNQPQANAMASEFGYTLMQTIEDKKSGSSFMVFVNAANEAIIACKGTDDLNAMKTDNLDIALGKMPGSINTLADELAEVMGNYEVVGLTGHSRGAAQATHLSSQYHIPAIVLDNPAAGHAEVGGQVISIQSAPNAVNSCSKKDATNTFYLPASHVDSLQAEMVAAGSMLLQTTGLYPLANMTAMGFNTALTHPLQPIRANLDALFARDNVAVSGSRVTP